VTIDGCMLTCIINSSDLTSITQPESLDWEMAIAKIAGLIIQEQSPARLLVIRAQLYDLITKCIQPSVILKRLTFYLLDKVNDSIKLKIIERAAYHVSFYMMIRIEGLLNNFFYVIGTSFTYW
jgi:hypothetical protein